MGQSCKRFGFRFAEPGDETALVWQSGYFNDFDREFHRTFNLYLDAMLEAFIRREKPPVRAVAGRRALQLAWAAVESFESGRRVTLGQ